MSQKTTITGFESRYVGALVVVAESQRTGTENKWAGEGGTQKKGVGRECKANK